MLTHTDTRAQYDFTRPFQPEAYRELLDLYARNPTLLRSWSPSDDGSVVFVDSHNLHAVKQCDALASPGCSLRGSITFPIDDNIQSDRRRITPNLSFPTRVPVEPGSASQKVTGVQQDPDPAGAKAERLNQGPGGDLSFLPLSQAVICKQSCRYHGVHHGQSWKYHWEFTSHKISAVEHRPDLAQSVHVVHIGRPDKAEAGKLLLTSSCEHKLRYKTSHGQLYGLSPDIESLCLKVFSATPSHPCMFEVVLPDSVRHPALDELNQSLAVGSLHVEFRDTWRPNPISYLIHTMVTKPPQDHRLSADTDVPAQLGPAVLESAAAAAPMQTASVPPLPGIAQASAAASSKNLTLNELQATDSADVFGTLTVNNFVQASDKRIKETIADAAPDALHKVNQLRPIAYNLVSCMKDRRQIDFSAQQIQAVLPEAAVVHSETGSCGVNPFPMLVTVIKSIQQLCESYAGHSSEIRQLQEKDNALGMQLLQLQVVQSGQQDCNFAADNDSLSAPTSDSQGETSAVSDATAGESDSAMPADKGSSSRSSDVAQTQSLLFLELTESAMVLHLLNALQEVQQRPAVGVKCSNSIKRLGPKVVWSCYQAVCGEVPGKRTNQFMKLLKKKEQEQKTRDASERESLCMSAPVRDYQQRLVEAAKTGNHIIVLPTGSGKTRIAIELSRQLLSSNPCKRVICLTPTVTLAQQQTAAFLAGLKPLGARVDCFTSENPINSSNWAANIAQFSVLVMTTQSFLNILKDGKASFQQIALMVIDECHHSQNEHPFNQVLAFYRRQSPEQQQNTQIIGLTAAPGDGRNLAAAFSKQEEVRRNMCATFLSVSDTQLVKQHAPDPEHLVHEVAPRPQDNSFATALAAVITVEAEVLATSLLDALQAPKLLHEINSSLSKSAFSAKLEGWLSQLLSAASSLPPGFQSSATLLRSCNTALNMVKDVGYESALHFLGFACAHASKAVREAASNPADPLHTCTSPTDTLLVALSAKVCNLSNVVDCLESSSAGHTSLFPKFQKLVQVLAELKAQKTAWHGMVFVQERQAVFQLTRMLQSTVQLAGVNFYPFTGLGRATAQRSAAPDTACTSTAAVPSGMKSKQRRSTFMQFRQATGCEVLVATAAAEEGIDVPACELVVCYTPVQSGRELTQKQGRARAMASTFVEFVEEGSIGALMQKKAREEQAWSQMAQELHMSRGTTC